MHTTPLRLVQCLFHNFTGNAVDLDIHLQRGDTLGGSRHLEVHVAQVILITQNVGQDCKPVTFLD